MKGSVDVSKFSPAAKATSTTATRPVFGASGSAPGCSTNTTFTAGVYVNPHLPARHCHPRSGLPRVRRVSGAPGVSGVTRVSRLYSLGRFSPVQRRSPPRVSKVYRMATLRRVATPGTLATPASLETPGRVETLQGAEGPGSQL